MVPMGVVVGVAPIGRARSRPGPRQLRSIRAPILPVSAEEADRLERGVPLDGPVYWTDRLVPEEATDDAIWMVMTIPSEDLAGAKEQPVHLGLGYREFELPPGIPAMFPVTQWNGWVEPTA